MTLIWLFQIALDVAVTIVLVKYFVGRKYGFLGLRDLISKEISAKDRLNTPLGSPISTLSEKKNSINQEAPNHSRVGLHMDTDSSLFGGAGNIKVRDAKRLLNQGISVQEVARRTGLSHAELVLLEKTMIRGLKDLS